MDLLLFQPETSEEQFQFYLHRVNGGLEGYKECFDWLLNAEEFHGESEWLQCMRNRAVQLSDIEHAFKMIDIICMQRQLLSCDEGSTDDTYRGVREVKLPELCHKDIAVLDQSCAQVITQCLYLIHKMILSS